MHWLPACCCGRDEAARKAGRKQLNFPDAARGETQAIKGRMELLGGVAQQRPARPPAPPKKAKGGGASAAVAPPLPQSKIVRDGSSGAAAKVQPYYRGVTARERNRWEARGRPSLGNKGWGVYLGNFATREAAARAWCGARPLALLPRA